MFLRSGDGHLSVHDAQAGERLANNRAALLEPLFAAEGTPYQDYHLQNENWPLLTHNIYFVKVELLTPSLINRVQLLLKERFPNCMLLENVGTKEPFEDVRVVMRVYADRIEEGLGSRSIARDLQGQVQILVRTFRVCDQPM